MRKFQFMVITLSLYLAGKTQACMKRSAFILSSVSFDPAFFVNSMPSPAFLPKICSPGEGLAGEQLLGS